MTVDAPEPVQLESDSWLWSLAIDTVPDVGADGARLTSREVITGYESLAEAVASLQPGRAAVQVRLDSHGAGAGNPLSPIDLRILGRARTREEALQLLWLVTAALPSDLEPRTETAAQVRAVVQGARRALDAPRASAVEVLRRVEEAAGDALPSTAGEFAQPVILRWKPETYGLRHTVSSMAASPTPLTVVMHMEPARPDQALLDFLRQSVEDQVGAGAPALNPWMREVIDVYRRRLRDWPRGALSVRVLCLGQQPVVNGIAHSLGLELTDNGSFTMIESTGRADLLLAQRLLCLGRSVPRRRPAGVLEELEALSYLCDIGEAAAVVRLPMPAYGGTPGMRSVPLNALPRGAYAHPRGESDSSVAVGPAAGGGMVALTHRDLNQHLLVAGLPGFGKTVSVQSLLVRLWEGPSRTPFLVIDPAKRDYRNLISALGEEVRVVRMSPDEVQFNPMGVPAGVTPLTHAGRVLAAFDAALRLSDWPVGHITFARALFRSYEVAEPGEAPDLDALEAAVEAVIAETGFRGEAAANALGSLKGRIAFLRHGPLGVALTGGRDHVLHMEDLLSRPTVVELRDFAGPTERSLIFALLMANVISFRESHSSDGRLAHVTVLEEAHRVLAGRSGAHNEGVRLFVEALAEQRGSGEGYVVVDQAPSMLDRGVLKLCGTVLSHRLIDLDERGVVGSALLLDERQQQDLARLRTGQAVVYGASAGTSALVDVDMVGALGRPAAGEAQAATVPWLSAPVRAVAAPRAVASARANRSGATLRDLAESIQTSIRSSTDLQDAERNARAVVLEWAAERQSTARKPRER